MSAGLPLLVTRPAPGNAATVGRARALGLDARAMPLFAARALSWPLPQIDAYDALMLTSVQALRLGGDGLAMLARLPVFAVGPATAAAAEAAGFAVAATGAGDAQRLLDAVTSQEKPRILWLCGQVHRKLDPRGAIFDPLACYAVDRIAPPPDWAGLIAAPAVILAHSARAAAQIAALAGARRRHLMLAAISPAAAAEAGDGWRALSVGECPDDAALLALAAALCHKGQK